MCAPPRRNPGDVIWYHELTYVYGDELEPGNWLDSLDRTGAREIVSIDLDDPDFMLRLVRFSNGRTEVVHKDVQYEIVDPDSQAGPDDVRLGPSYCGMPGLVWYSEATPVRGADLEPGQWLDSLDHSGARLIHSIRDDDPAGPTRIVLFSDDPEDSEVVDKTVTYDVVNPDSMVEPDGTPAL